MTPAQHRILGYLAGVEGVSIAVMARVVEVLTRQCGSASRALRFLAACRYSDTVK